VAIIKSIDDTRYQWPHLLEAINLSVPQYTWLTTVTQTSKLASTAALIVDSAAKAGAAPKAKATPASRKAHADSLFNGAASVMDFRIVGQTVDVQALTQFMKTLEASPFIKNVQLTRSDLVMSHNKEVTEFQLEAQSETPAASLLRTVPLSIAVR
jgi:Tfp pilus assembly protein PilN